MNFSKKTEYALRIMRFMALDEKKLYSANEIYDNLKIPYRYLRKLLTILSKSKLIQSVQGKKGGYRISLSLSEISLFDIIQATGDDLITNECFFGFGSCVSDKKCAIHDKWTAGRENLNHVLTTTTLDDIKQP